MPANDRSRQNLSARLDDVLRLYRHETDDTGLHALAERIGETPHDLRRWASGTTLPGHVLSMLLGALPDHLADMLIAPTGKRVEIRYMDFWKVEDGRITDNYVMVDFPHVMAQLGVDAFNGEGWEAFDRGEKTPPHPNTQ